MTAPGAAHPWRLRKTSAPVAAPGSRQGSDRDSIREVDTGHRCQPSLPLVVSLLAVGGTVAVGTCLAVLGVILNTPNRRRCQPRRLL